MKNNKKGFTLAELLIVVAIIAVLVAISIPIFSTQLEKAREATDMANVRSKYAELAVSVLDTSGSASATVNATAKQTSWVTSPVPKIAGVTPSKKSTTSYTVKVAKDGTVTVTGN